MTDNRLSLFCLVEGESSSVAFPVKTSSADTVGDLKNLIVNGDQAPAFKDVASKDLTLWRVSIPIEDDEVPILLNNVTHKDKKKLGPATRLSKVFPEELAEETVHIIVQRPPQGDLRVDIKKIADKVFAPGSPITDFLDAFVRVQRNLPVTTGPIRGLPRAWRRSLGHPVETRPSLLFLDLPDPSAPDSASRNLASASILDMR
ncbi:hypothetical protein BGZ81_011501 [Podila clonocystis]|nr:hypothetical protein BGZ81_011501 [Podila clonocystis]